MEHEWVHCETVGEWVGGCIVLELLFIKYNCSPAQLKDFCSNKCDTLMCTFIILALDVYNALVSIWEVESLIS